MSKTVKVVTISVGFYQGLREVNDVFEVPEDIVKGSKWFEPVKAEAEVSGVDDNQQSKTDDEKPINRMNKAELIAVAQEKGITLSGSETNAVIIELLNAAS